MANKSRYRYGETSPPVVVPVDSAQVVEIGDLIWLNTDDGRPASQLTYVGLAATQGSLVDNFLGVAQQQSISGDTKDIRVGTSGVYEFETAADQFELGDLVAAADNSGSTALENQKVVSLGDGHTDANVSRAIGRCAKRAGSNVTSVLVEIKSTVMTGGYQLGTASV